jgi:hypothetical protein
MRWTAGVLLVSFFACDDAGSYVYAGRAYDAEQRCLDPYQALDVVRSKGGSAGCEAVCLMKSGTAYVSTMCAPYPFGFELTAAEDPLCKDALTALKCGSDCGTDGGPPSECTFGAPDAAEPQETGPDAGEDANSTDAAPE